MKMQTINELNFKVLDYIKENYSELLITGLYGCASRFKPDFFELYTNPAPRKWYHKLLNTKVFVGRILITTNKVIGITIHDLKYKTIVTILGNALENEFKVECRLIYEEERKYV